MNLEQQVCSLDLSKRLKELGIKQQSYLWWSISHPEVAEHNEERQALEQTRSEVSHGKWATKDGKLEDISAFTVAELGRKMEKAKKGDFLRAYCEVMDLSLDQTTGPERALMAAILMTEVDIAAKMLIYLIENKLITI